MKNGKAILAGLILAIPLTYYISSEFIFKSFEVQTERLYLCLEGFDSLHKYEPKNSIVYLNAKKEIEDACGVTYEEVYNVNTPK